MVPAAVRDCAAGGSCEIGVHVRAGKRNVLKRAHGVNVRSQGQVRSVRVDKTGERRLVCAGQVEAGVKHGRFHAGNARDTGKDRPGNRQRAGKDFGNIGHGYVGKTVTCWNFYEIQSVVFLIDPVGTVQVHVRVVHGGTVVNVAGEVQNFGNSDLARGKVHIARVVHCVGVVLNQFARLVGGKVLFRGGERFKSACNAFGVARGDFAGNRQGFVGFGERGGANAGV